MKTRHFIPGSVVQIVALAGLAAALSAAGCDRRTPSAKAVSSSSTKLQTVLSSSSTRTEESGKTFARDQYSKVIDTVQQAGDDGLAGEAAAAKLLAAESQLGLTEQPLDTATRLETQADNAATVLRSVLSSWIAENAAADAASLYDPSKNIADAQKSAADFDSQAAEASGLRDKLADQIKALESQAGSKMQQVLAEETELAKIRDHAAGVKATEAAKLIEQVAERRKSADKVRTEASLLQAQADQLQPQFREAELLVQQYKAQAQTYRNLIEEMQTRLTTKQEEVQKARAAAGAAAQEIDSQVKELADLRAGALAEAYNSTFQVFNAASQAVTGAKQDQDLSAAKVTDGNIKQGLGDAYWSQAQGLLRFEGLLRRLAEVKPPLPNAAAYTEQAEQAAKSAAEALESARSAYESAASAYGGVRIRGDAGERLKLLGSKLEAISKITAGQNLDALAALAAGTFKPAEEPEAAPDEQPAETPDVAPVESDPNADLTAAIDSMLNAIRSGDQAAMTNMVSAEPPVQALVVGQLAQVGAVLKLDAACQEKFQARFSERLAGMAQAMGQQGTVDGAALARLADAKAADLNPVAEGDTATITIPGINEPLPLKKVDGAWKIVPGDVAADLAAVPGLTVERLGQINAATNEVFVDLTNQVNDGTLTSIDAVMAAFQAQTLTKLMPIMQQIQSERGGGGG